VAPGQVRAHADDLGLHASIDRAIFRAYESGALAGASILVGGPTFHDAVAEARRLQMPIWLHLALVDSAPISSPAEIRSLVGFDGRFPQVFSTVAARALTGRLNGAEVRLEVMRQIQCFANTGLADRQGVCLDGHQHLHVLPVVADAIAQLADAWKIRAVRRPTLSPAEKDWRSVRSSAFRVVELLARRTAGKLRARGIETVSCWGTVFAGGLTLERARAILESLPSGASGQLICHPGDDNGALSAVYPWRYDWEGDLATILSLPSHSNSH
jgi:predicted glycoside hydrolase/deacetylase ChbG (UPF0249 family)